MIKPQFDWTSTFREGLAVVRIGSKRGFIDKKGKLTIVLGATGIRDFHDGVAAVQAGDDNWGYIDKCGKYIVKPDKWGVSDFSEGLGFVHP